MAESYLRNVIGGYMTALGEKDERVVVVNADLMGTCRNRSFVEKYPERSFNVGIAEQNMISFSAGLAHEGFIPYAFTMAPFMSMPSCPAPPRPAKKLRGILTTSAHGQLMTRKMSALYIHVPHRGALPAARFTRGGRTARHKAPMQTAGV